jgi:hypothetical protein
MRLCIQGNRFGLDILRPFCSLTVDEDCQQEAESAFGEFIAER